ncbi:PrsW family intramembrane metalloprotease [Micromonospora echinofusca]|uniref:PrsW family intramembrane metalloprotease n=1 Tax=Micromonospora echinofusca TaxID=47858 RepID=A0ABS3VIX0_MICEH|nr:PrsW family glutamic-type intramembrane protease [Micromonospora echinofusca]MBO4204462.1 PrsW family intramembrane metalloprotease [Micromonospora echinofusca]
MYRLDRLAVALTTGEALLVMIAVASLVGVIRRDNTEVRVLGMFNLGAVGISLFAACIAAVVVAISSATGGSPRRRYLTWVVCGGLVFAAPTLLGVFLTLLQVGIAWRGALLSIPTTLFALWTFRRMQRNRKPSWRLVVVAFAWGLFIAAYFAQMVEGILHVVITAELLPGTATILSHAAAAAVPEEVGKGAGVLVIVLLAWRHVDGMLGGIVVGACVGIGFQFAESMSYMTGDLGAVLYQHWYRQVTGLLISHATYTGIIGAGIGLAMQVDGWRRQAVCVGSGFAVAIAAHLIWDVFAMGRLYWESDDSLLQLFVVQPLNLIVLKGPAFAVLVFLVIVALRRETRALYRQLQEEARDPGGAISPAEVPVLVSPPLRFRMRLQALLRRDRPAYTRMKRLHSAQLDLAFARWGRDRGEPYPPGAQESLRQRIHELKAECL